MAQYPHLDTKISEVAEAVEVDEEVEVVEEGVEEVMMIRTRNQTHS